MDSLQDRLEELADRLAPTGGAPAAELWSRGRREHRVRVAAIATAVLVIGAVGIGIGLAGDGQTRLEPTPAPSTHTVTANEGLTLPIQYPAEQELPRLGGSPGRLAAVWLLPATPGGASQAVGLVEASGAFGSLPVVVSYPEASDGGIALSPDGRRLAFQDLGGELVVRDLVNGESYPVGPGADISSRFTWITDTLLVGRLVGRLEEAGGADAWVWRQDRGVELVDSRTYEFETSDAVWFGQPGAAGPGTRDWWVAVPGGGPGSCSSPVMQNWSTRFEIPQLCDVLGFLPNDVLLGHQHVVGARADEGNGTVVAQDHGDFQVVVRPGAPDRVALAREVIYLALDSAGGAS